MLVISPCLHFVVFSNFCTFYFNSMNKVQHRHCFPQVLKL
uniref:Uncharacterized protein n=1 Tax=Rhizophora mucronata TaxID=61149 RepID=A0A2P2N1U1_RHIMU